MTVNLHPPFGPHFTLRQLQVFCAVAAAGTTAAAAAAVALSQSATSAALNELEFALGMPLFERIGRRLRLNDNGRALIPAARSVLDGAQSIGQWASDRESQVGSLRIGASTTIGNYLLPGILAGFKASLDEGARAGWHAYVSIANTAAIAARLAAFDLDLGLLEGPCHDPSLTVRPWCEDELVVVAAASDPLLRGRKKHRLSLQELGEATWLFREEGSGTREVISQLLAPHLSRMRIGVEFGNSEAIKRAVSSGLGIACLSRCIVEDMVRAGTLVTPPTALPPLRRRFNVVIHERKSITRGMELLLQHLERYRHVAGPPRR